MSDPLGEVRKRDAESAAPWFKVPALGACGRAFIDRRWLLGEYDELRELLDEAAPLLRWLASHCEGCQGAGEIIRGGPAPEDEYSEPCKHCAPTWSLIERIEPRAPPPPPPPRPAPVQEEDDDIAF